MAISAGNSWDARGHASGTINPNDARTLGWEIDPIDVSWNEFEVWYGSGDELAISLTTPSGQQLNPVGLGTTVTLTAGGKTVGRIFHRAADPNNGDNHIDILLSHTLPGGVWEVRLENVGPGAADFDAYIERDDGPNRQSRLVSTDAEPAGTIGSISCGTKTIAVGSYLSGVPNHEPSPFSAEGPTRDGKEKPEISAPGQFVHPFWKFGILAARSLAQGATRMSGTSMASPHVAGVIALLMQVADHDLTVEEIRQMLQNTARIGPPAVAGWHPRYGHGRVDALAALQQITGTVFPTVTPAARISTAGASIEAPFAAFVESAAASAARSGARVRIKIDVEPVGSRQ